MKSQAKLLFLILVVFAIILASCGLDGELSMEDLEEGDMELPGEEVIVDPHAGEGNGTIYYHYHFKNDLMEFKLDPVIGISFSQEENASTFDVLGIGETMVNLWMLAQGGPTGSCHVQCEMKVSYAAIGTIELGSAGACELHMNFVVEGTNDESILTGDCPDEFMAVYDCAAMTAVMMDPSLYVFSRKDPSPKIKTAPAVTLKAELKDLVLPTNSEGLCTW